MFETFPESQVPANPFFESNRYEWDFVMLSLDVPWFYIKWSFRSSASPSDARSELRLIPSIDQLKMHLQEVDSEYYVSDIQFVSPGWLNGSNHSQMHKLIKLVQYTDSFEANRSVHRFAYEMEDGIRLPAGLDWENLGSVVVVYERGFTHP